VRTPNFAPKWLRMMMMMMMMMSSYVYDFNCARAGR